ncbi:MAG: ATP-grasp domain-containing protein [Deltaproteobacteria bacterium]|nr:ATP-grasp domain-containing protein [Deltaproteobacteria bacterium]
MIEKILIIPEKADIERDSVAIAWENMGGKVLRIGKFWQPPKLDPSNVHVYGNDTFCLVLQQKLGFNLISPTDDIFAKIKKKWLKRKITFLKLSDIKKLMFPTFLKSAVPKIFKASVYESLDEVKKECTKLPEETLIIQSEIVNWLNEARAFIHKGIILDCSVYEGSGDLENAKSFLKECIAEIQIPETCVIDFGEIEGKGWALVEFNASWGAGLNGCKAEKVLPAIIDATYC